MTSPTPQEPGNELELRGAAPVPARANIDRELTDSWVDVIRPITILAGQIAATTFVPAAFREDPAAVAAAILHGRELGLPPMTALALTDPIKGKPTIKAEGGRALVLAAGHDLETTETTSSRCVMRGKRRGQTKWTEITWTLDQARLAGLTTKDTWRAYPRAMLQARASAELLRLVFPDVLHGMGFAEESQDLDDDAGDEVAPVGTPPAAPAQRVGRATTRKTTPAKPPAAPLLSGELGAVPSTPPAPLEVDVPLPDAPGPSGAGDPLPAPEAGTSGAVDVVESAGSVARQALEEHMEERYPSDQDDAVTARELRAQLAGPQTDQEVVDQAAADAPERDQPAEVVYLGGGPKVSAAQLRMLGALWSGLKVGDEDRRAYTETLIGHDLEAGTTKSLTKREATFLIDGLNKIKTVEQLEDAIASRIAIGAPIEAPAADDQGGES